MWQALGERSYDPSGSPERSSAIATMNFARSNSSSKVTISGAIS
jgi:hypothetical protein